MHACAGNFHLSRRPLDRMLVEVVIGSNAGSSSAAHPNQLTEVSHELKETVP
jgi:hypothetical protein